MQLKVLPVLKLKLVVMLVITVLALMLMLMLMHDVTRVIGMQQARLILLMMLRVLRMVRRMDGTEFVEMLRHWIGQNFQCERKS